jgi:hypothetical protein
MPLIASRWLGQPQTTATRRGFSKWQKHGGISPSWRKLGRPLGTTRTADRKIIDTTSVGTDTIDYVATDSAGLTATSTRTVIIQATNDNQAPSTLSAANDNAPPLAATGTTATSSTQ